MQKWFKQWGVDRYLNVAQEIYAWTHFKWTFYKHIKKNIKARRKMANLPIITCISILHVGNHTWRLRHTHDHTWPIPSQWLLDGVLRDVSLDHTLRQSKQVHGMGKSVKWDYASFVTSKVWNQKEHMICYAQHMHIYRLILIFLYKDHCTTSYVLDMLYPTYALAIVRVCKRSRGYILYPVLKME